MKNTDFQKMINYLNRNKIPYKHKHLKDGLGHVVIIGEKRVDYFENGNIDRIWDRFGGEIMSGHRQALNYLNIKYSKGKQ